MGQQKVGVGHGKRRRTVLIPKGWFRVVQGEVEPGDMFYNVQTSEWQEAEFENFGDPAEEIQALIRRIET